MVRTRPLPLDFTSRLEQPGSIPALVLPSGGMAVRHRKGATAERNVMRPPHIPVATIFETSRYTYIRNALLIRLLKIFRQPTTGFALFGAYPHKPSQYKNRSVILREAFGCSTLSVPRCHAIHRKLEGWDTAKLLRPRQGQSRGRGLVRTTDLPDWFRPSWGSSGKCGTRVYVNLMSYLSSIFIKSDKFIHLQTDLVFTRDAPAS
ncbi:hypothetical protein CSKR_107924 [Clonorchis sinensis]|uniref:Uncharacterized protein n=1 Tax=Clonorchis sinensis TaxID=79923 RepID=A0A419PN17_CLOSI|nr:hypothetical protein CSKR_107924 [Clonorchis sinensis]